MPHKPKRRSFYGETWFARNFIRPIAQELMLLTWNTDITPNQISISRILLMVPLVWCIVQANHVYAFVAVFCFLFMEILDHLDGMLARAKNMSSLTGQYIEVISDEITSSPNFILGIVITLTLNDQFLLAFLIYSLICEKIFIFLRHNINLNGEILHEKTHEDEFLKTEPGVVGFLLGFFRALFIWKPLLLMTLYYLSIVFAENALMYVFYFYIANIWLFMSLKHLRQTWKQL